MKKCKFCESVVNAEANACPSCGANEFKYVCDNCGTAFEDGPHCPKCGVKVGQKQKTCPKCGNTYYTNACPNCGYSNLSDNSSQVYPSPYAPATNKKTVILVLTIFLGMLGFYQFYKGKIGMGILYLFTGGLLYIGWIRDIIEVARTPEEQFK